MFRHTRSALALCLSLAVAAPLAAWAKTECLEAFNKRYKVPAGSALASKACWTCHRPKKYTRFNPYGRDVLHAMRAANQSAVTPAVLEAVEGLDSSKNGTTNLSQIRAGLPPGEHRDPPKKPATPAQGHKPDPDKRPSTPVLEPNWPKPQTPPKGHRVSRPVRQEQTPPSFEMPVAACVVLAGLALASAHLLRRYGKRR